VPYRGKRNEPAYVARVVAALAEMHQIPPGDLAARTTANFHTLFRP
jgi:TatD DNase family protein